MPRLLFVHGLESGPGGKKARALRAAGFELVAGRMPCGRRAIARDPVVVASLVASAAGLIAATLTWGALGLLVGLLAIAALQQFGRPLLVRRVLRRSVAVQVALLREHEIDAVVGSSFGGAVAIELLRRGTWRGPTLLLCPAHELVASRARMPAPSLPADASRIRVVHGRRDQTVPIEHSQRLVRGTRATLIEVDDDHRLSQTATSTNLRAWLDPILADPSSTQQ
ncbi:alpha/beta hydrolase family protein [Nannocystaceae bacterium ST9]